MASSGKSKSQSRSMSTSKSRSRSLSSSLSRSRSRSRSGSSERDGHRLHIADIGKLWLMYKLNFLNTLLLIRWWC